MLAVYGLSVGQTATLRWGWDRPVPRDWTLRFAEPDEAGIHEDALALVAEGAVDLKSILTDVIPFDDVATVFDVMDGPTSAKVAIDFRTEQERTMTDARAISFLEQGKIALVDIHLPEPGPTDVVVETELTAVSQGTDRAMVAGTYRGIADRYPLIYGYSRVGWVTALGSDVKGLAVGDRVFVGMGGTRLDPADGYGPLGGGYTSIGVVDETDVVKLPAEIDSATAAVAALGAIAYQGVARSQIGPSSRVLVVDWVPSASSAHSSPRWPAPRCGWPIPSRPAASSPPGSRARRRSTRRSRSPSRSRPPPGGTGPGPDATTGRSRATSRPDGPTRPASWMSSSTRPDAPTPSRRTCR